MSGEYAVLGRKQWIAIIVVMSIFILGGAAAYLVFGYHVTKVKVEGNLHYTEKEIEAMVLKGNWMDNSILLSLQYRNKSIEGVPFIESMDVEVESKNTIKIAVYEKALAGCVNYLGQYMYFDREGIVVEVSGEVTEGVPEVTGLDFTSVMLHEPLPVEDTEVFSNILSISQLLDKYEIAADKIHFDNSMEVTLYYDEVRVKIGDDRNLDEKIMQLPGILEELTGKKGVLWMDDYTQDTQTVTFEMD